MRWVKDTFRPASLSSRLRASSAVTVRVRKLVAVGIERDCSMYRARAAAPPRSGRGPAAGAVAALPLVVVPAVSRFASPRASGVASPAADRTSDLVIRPAGPL